MTAKELKIKHLLERIAAEQDKINERKGIIKVYEKELLKLGYTPKTTEK